MPTGYDHKNPSGLGEITYDSRGNPAKAEVDTSVIDLAAAGELPGVPPLGGLKAVIQAGLMRAIGWPIRKCAISSCRLSILVE